MERFSGEEEKNLIHEVSRVGLWGRVLATPGCPECPQHIHTDAEASVSYPEFCEAFGFPVGPSGTRTLLLLYELWGQDGTLVQRGRASGCPQLGLHPDALLLGTQGYLYSVLEECAEVSSVMLYSNSTPCQECATALLAFLDHHHWVRLDLFFSQLHRPQDPNHQTGLRRLAARWPRVTLSPLSGSAWPELVRRFVRDAPPSAAQGPPLPGRTEADRRNAAQLSIITGIGPAFLELPPGTDRPFAADPPDGQAQAPSPLPRINLHPTPTPPPYQRAALRKASPARPINVVRHVGVPRPRGSRARPGVLSPASALCASSSPLLLPGRPVEVLEVTEREVTPDSSSYESSRRSRANCRWSGQSSRKNT